jgi:hypothetical protein
MHCNPLPGANVHKPGECGHIRKFRREAPFAASEKENIIFHIINFVPAIALENSDRRASPMPKIKLRENISSFLRYDIHTGAMKKIRQAPQGCIQLSAA